MSPRTLAAWFGAALLVVFVGCAPADGDGFSFSDHDVDDPADLDDPDLDDEGADQDLGDEDDVDVEDDDPELPDWDFTPPEGLAEGTVLVWQIDCGMLEGSGANVWEWAEDGWLGFEDGEDLPDVDLDLSGGGYPYDELMPCLRPTIDRSMEWDDDGSIRFFNGQWLHDMRPSPTEGLWIGAVTPQFEPSEACHEAMSGLGLQIPVTLTIQSFELVDPAT